MDGSTRQIIKGMCFLAAVIVIGTLGYYVFEEGWSLQEALYMTVITITTVGFSEIRTLSANGRMFTVGLIFVGFGGAAVLASQIARVIIQSELKGYFVRKKMKSKISRLKKHHIVCGFGRTGGAIAREMKKEKLPLVIIELDEELAESAKEEGFCVVQGNATTDAVLQEAGIDRASGIVAALAEDEKNLFVSLAARELNPDILVVARAENPKAENRILRAGGDIVVSPHRLGGQQIAQLISHRDQPDKPEAQIEGVSGVLGFCLRVSEPVENDEMTVAEVLKASDALLAVAMKRSDGTILVAPPTNIRVSPSDSLILLMKNETIYEETATDKDEKKRKVLVVDDQASLRELFCKKVSSAGYEALMAGDGDEALSVAETHAPDLVVLDAAMPGKSGYEVCRLLKQMPTCSHVPVVICSTDDPETLYEKGKEAGADLCMAKTNKSSDLLSKIEELLPVS